MNNIKSIVSYNNAEKYKSLIYKENKNKSGIYRWTNLITGKSYVGSSNNLFLRFKKYYSPYHLKSSLKRSKSIIYNSLLKNGYEKFKLDILEYITFSTSMTTEERKNFLLDREQHYFKWLNPEYNILTRAGSRLGAKHSAECIKFIREKALARPKIYSEETILKMSSHQGFPVFVYEKCDSVAHEGSGFQLVGSFVSAKKAAKLLGFNNKTICTYRKTGKIFKNKYLFLPAPLNK